MNTANNLLAINCLGIVAKAEVDAIVEHKLSRLKRVCRQIETCKVRVANIAHKLRGEPGHAYLVSISLCLSNGVELYTLRSPFSSKDSLEIAIADVFAKVYRQLIELQIEEKIEEKYILAA